MDSAKIDLSQNQDKWDTEKTKILQQHNTKVQEKETEVQKMSELQSDLESAKYDLEKEREALIELSDKLDAKEVASEKLEGILKQLQTDMATELAAKKSLVAELDDAKTSMATNINTMNDLKSENDDLQVSTLGYQINVQNDLFFFQNFQGIRNFLKPLSLDFVVFSIAI